ncbi:hypothetical protein Hdeb2414_s0879g00957061 [Helianthus debilis subsp. tardiflorus]
MPILINFIIMNNLFQRFSLTDAQMFVLNEENESSLTFSLNILLASFSFLFAND